MSSPVDGLFSSGVPVQPVGTTRGRGAGVDSGGRGTLPALLMRVGTQFNNLNTT
jgi:hypothetical protein